MSGRVENNGCIGEVGWKGPEIPPVSATQHAPSPHKLHSDNMLVMYKQQKRHRLIEGRGGETPSGGAHLGSGTSDPSARPPALNQANARELMAVATPVKRRPRANSPVSRSAQESGSWGRGRGVAWVDHPLPTAKNDHGPQR